MGNEVPIRGTKSFELNRNLSLLESLAVQRENKEKKTKQSGLGC